MKFRITRTSDPLYEIKPCDEAKAEGFDKYGYNIYTIEINTLEELLELIRKEGSLVIGRDSIEIYDCYRE